jgi:hypothetical protein
LSAKRTRGNGILNIDVQNQCLLSKWLFKLLNEEGVWQDILKKKYMNDKATWQVQRKPDD